MAEATQEDLVPVGFEPVHVEGDWYDGPRSGLADVNGSMHYFQAVYDHHHPDEPDDEYFVWPASDTAVAMEREQWAIFAEWSMRYETDKATAGPHPAGTNSRYDELATLLVLHRAIPDQVRRLAADWHWGNRPAHYPPSGPIYWVKWHEPNQ